MLVGEGRSGGVTLHFLFCKSERKFLTMPEPEFNASHCRRILDTEIQVCKLFLQKEDKHLTLGRIEGALNKLKEKEELLRKSFEKLLLSCKDVEILDTEERVYKQVLEEAITMEVTLSNRLKHLKNLENQNIVTVPSVTSESSCPTLTSPSNAATSPGASRNMAPGATGCGSSSSSVVNLPTLRVPKFSGDPTDWPNFWSFFDNLVHSNPHLSTVVKFTHLHESLTYQAAESIRGFVHLSEDYEEAVNLLRERYGDRIIAKKQLMRKLFKLSVPSTTKDSLLSFVNEVDTLMRSRKVYVKDPENNWVIPLVLLEYLPDEVFQWVVREVGETEVTVRDIIKWIQLYVVNLEGGKRSSNPQDPHLIGRGTMQRPSKGSVGSYAVTQIGQDKDECFFCSGSGHKPANCGKAVSVEARKAKLIELRRCLRCTSTTHYASKCSARLTCEI